MSYDLVEIAGRVQRLERDNRRLKLGAGALVALLVAVPLVGAVLPAQVPEVIEARAFRVLDENGTPRAGLGAPGLAFYHGGSDEPANLEVVCRNCHICEHRTYEPTPEQGRWRRFADDL